MSAEDRITTAAARYDGPDDEAARLTEQTLRRRDWRLRRGGKTCVRCARTKPTSDFSIDSRERDGLNRRCRACR